MPTCLFCDNPAGNKEHVWPQWILARKHFGPTRLQIGKQKEVILNNTELITRSVCEQCNTGWMSDLENAVKPILIPMFEDRRVTLTSHQQKILGAWIAKMALVFDSMKGRNAPNRFYTISEGKSLRQSLEIPEISRIWIGRFAEPYPSIWGTDIRRQAESEAVDGTVVTLTREHFVGQIVTLHLSKTPTGPVAIPLEENPFDWDHTRYQFGPQWNPQSPGRLRIRSQT